jgi:hypothetical protein
MVHDFVTDVQKINRVIKNLKKIVNYFVLDVQTKLYYYILNIFVFDAQN